MHRMLKLALGWAVTMALATPALAQDQFPDVPDNHWAYEALRNLKDRVLFGYPDKLYRGSRPLSRYEFAVGIHQLWQLLTSRVTTLEDQVKALDELIKNGGQPENTGSLQALRDQMTAITGRIDALEKGNGDLLKLVKEFETELATLGVSVDEIRKSVGELDGRVKKLEDAKTSVVISGDVNLLILAGGSDDAKFGLTTSGRRLGVGRGSYANQPVGMTRDLSVLHEAALTLNSTNEKGPKFKATFVLGNLFDSVGNVSTPGQTGAAFSDSASDLYIQELVAVFDSAMLGQTFSASVGRIGYQISPYLFKRTDYTPFYANERWDNGNWTLDGGLLSFNFGSAKLNVFGGRNNARTNKGTRVDPIGFFNGTIDRTFGADLMVPLGKNFEFRGAYLFHDSDTVAATSGGPANRVNVYGGEIKGTVGQLKVGATYAKTPITENSSKRVDSQNQAFDLKVGYETPRAGITGGYREIQRNFSAAGDWGRLGLLWNPKDVRGYYVNGYFQLSEDLKVTASGQFMEGKDGTLLGLTKDDDITSFELGLDYRLQNGINLSFGYEDTKLAYKNNPPGWGDPSQRWYTLGLKWNMSENALFSLMYQVSDVDFRGWPFGAVYGDPNGRYKGGLLGTQLSIKF
jgi:hypothetical protein